MSTQDAERYGRRARDADNVEELGGNVKKAIEQLTRAIKNLEQRLSKVERSQR